MRSAICVLFVLAFVAALPSDQATPSESIINEAHGTTAQPDGTLPESVAETFLEEPALTEVLAEPLLSDKAPYPEKPSKCSHKTCSCDPMEEKTEETYFDDDGCESCRCVDFKLDFKPKSKNEDHPNIKLEKFKMTNSSDDGNDGNNGNVTMTQLGEIPVRAQASMVHLGLLCAPGHACVYKFKTSTTSHAEEKHAEEDQARTVHYDVKVVPTNVLTSKHIVWAVHYNKIALLQTEASSDMQEHVKKAQEHPVRVVQDPTTGRIEKFILNKDDNKNARLRSFKVGSINALNHVRAHTKGVTSFSLDETFPTGSRASVKHKVSSGGVASHSVGLPDASEYDQKGHQSIHQHSKTSVAFSKDGHATSIKSHAETVVGHVAAPKHQTSNLWEELTVPADVTGTTRPSRMKMHNQATLEVSLSSKKASLPANKATTALDHKAYIQAMSKSKKLVATDFVQLPAKASEEHDTINPAADVDRIFKLAGEKDAVSKHWRTLTNALAHKKLQDAVVSNLVQNFPQPDLAINNVIAAIGASGLDVKTVHNLMKLVTGKYVVEDRRRAAVMALVQPHCQDHVAIGEALDAYSKSKDIQPLFATQLLQVQHALAHQHVHCGGTINKDSFFASLIDESHQKLKHAISNQDKEQALDILTAMGNSKVKEHAPVVSKSAASTDETIAKYAKEIMGRLVEGHKVTPAAELAEDLVSAASKEGKVTASLEYKKAWPLPQNGDIRCDVVAGVKLGAESGGQPKVEAYGGIEGIAWKFTMMIIKIGIEKERNIPITAFIEVLGFRVKSWPAGKGGAPTDDILPRLPGNPASATSFKTQSDQQGYCEYDIDECAVKGAIEFSKEFLRVQRSFFVGPVPLTASVFVTGALGLKFGYEHAMSSGHSKKKCTVGQILALVPYANAKLTGEAGVDVLIAQGGMGISVMLVQLSFPLTNEWDIPRGGNTSPGRSCKGANVKVEGLGGELYAWAKTIKGVECTGWQVWKDCGRVWHEYKFTFYDWASPAEWKSNNIQCSGTGGTTLSQSGGTLSNNGIEYDYPTNYIGSWMDSSSRAFAHGPKQYGYDAASCRVACKEYKWIALQDGGWCSCSNDWVSVSKYGKAKRCWPNGGPYCNAVFGVEPDDLFAKYVTLTHSKCGQPVDSTALCNEAATTMKYIGWMGEHYYYYAHDIKVVYWKTLNECVDECHLTSGCKAIVRLANKDDGVKCTCYLKSQLLYPGAPGILTNDGNNVAGWQVYGVEQAKSDHQVNGVYYDPSFCYWENDQLKFNQGANTGSCSGSDRCLCVNHCDSFYYAQRKKPGHAYASTEGVYLEEPLNSVNGRNIWVNAEKDRFMYLCPGGSNWAVTSMSNYLEAIVRDGGAGCGAFQHCIGCYGTTPHDANWHKAGFETSPLCGNSQFDLFKDGKFNHHAAGTYEIDLKPSNAIWGVPIWKNKKKGTFAFYCGQHDQWWITHQTWIQQFIDASGSHCPGGYYLMAHAGKSLNPRHLNFGSGWTTRMD